MESQETSMPDGGDSIDLGAILHRLWQGRLAVGFFCALFTLLGILYLHFATYTYTSTLVVVPTQGQNQGGTAGQLGGLASLAGIDISGSQNVSPFTLYPDVMKTRVVADLFAVRYPDLMHHLFATQWDAREGWHDPGGGFLRGAANVMKALLGFPQRTWHPPAGGDVQEIVSTRVLALLDSKKPVLTVTFNDRDPVFARQFLQALHESTDQILRRATLDRSSKYARYLRGELLNVQQTELRQVLTNSLSQQETLIMMSSSDTPFAAQPIGTAVSSMGPTSPKPIMILFVVIMVGLGFGMGWLYLQLPWFH